MKVKERMNEPKSICQTKTNSQKEEIHNALNKLSRTNGITLIALVVTIVILIILATISISALFGENGLIKKAQEAKQHQSNAIAMEEGEMDKLAGEYANIMEGGPATPTDTTGPTINIEVVTITDTSIQIKATATDESGLSESDTYKFYINEEEKETNTTGECTFSGLTAATKYTIKVEVKDKVGNLGSATKEITTSAPTISTSTSYVGYYADINGDKQPEGVIYADLAVGGSGTGLGQSYSIPKINSGLKSYYVSQTGYSGQFGTKDVLTATGTTGEDRFYVMALTDIDGKQDGTSYCWYADAYGKMNDYGTATTTEFGSGKTNTANMIAKWNSSGYGSQNTGSYPDIWGVITPQTEQGWFVPSKGEWAAFTGAFGITADNYSNTFGLSLWYWLSSQYDNNYACFADFNDGDIYDSEVDYNRYVRLSTTF